MYRDGGPTTSASSSRTRSGAEPEAFVEDRDPLSYLYTSGTTSAPKGVVSSHLAVYLESLGAAIDTRLSSDDRMTALMPMFHTAQLNAFVTPAIAVGAAVFIQKGFEADRLLDLIESERLTVDVRAADDVSRDGGTTGGAASRGRPLEARRLCDGADADA